MFVIEVFVRRFVVRSFVRINTSHRSRKIELHVSNLILHDRIAYFKLVIFTILVI